MPYINDITLEATEILDTTQFAVSEGSTASDQKKLAGKIIKDYVKDRISLLDVEGSVAKAIDDAVSPLAEKVDNNRLYSDSQYLELKAKADAQALEIQASRAELYNGYKILQFGSTDIIGKGTKADYSAVDVSANVVDGSLELEQRGLTITNLVDGASIANLGTVTFTTILNDKYFDTLNVAILTGTGSDMTATNNSGATANMAIYHLTALGLSTITDTAILAKLLPYVDGTKNVGKMGMRVVNKNLIESVKQIYEGAASYLYTYLDGRFCARFTSSVNIEKTPITFLPSQQYTVTFEYQTRIKTAGGDGEVVFAFFYTDGTRSRVAAIGNVNTTSWIKRTLTSTAGKTVRSVGVYSSDYRTYVYVSEDSFQLELGATSTTVEPYQEQLTFLPAIGNSLPNGVADSVKTTVDGCEHTKRVERYVLQASDIIAYDSTYTNVDILGIKKNADYVGNNQTWVWENKKNWTINNSWIEKYYTYADRDNAAHIGFFTGGWSLTNVQVVLTKGTYADLTAARTALAGTVIYYQLATPITTHYDLPHLTSGKTIHRFAGEEKIALYSTGLTFSENVLSVLSAVKFVAGVMTDITDLATITDDTVTFSGVNATDVVYVKVEHDVDKPLGVLEHTPAVSNTASRLAELEGAYEIITDAGVQYTQFN